MDPLDDPFAAVDQAVAAVAMPDDADAIVLDFHGEATSEKMSMGHFLDGRATLVVGTHSHVPTADAQILPGGTAYQTDAGMCGDYDSVIGMKKSAAMARFVTKMPGERLTPAESAATLCGLVVDTDDKTGLAMSASPRFVWAAGSGRNGQISAPWKRTPRRVGIGGNGACPKHPNRRKVVILRC